MTSPDTGIEAQIRNIGATYGKPLREWFTVIHASGLTKHTEIIAMLKQRHGMKYGAAHRVASWPARTNRPKVPTATSPSCTPADRHSSVRSTTG
ncbi:MAG: DUF4287 domain-containing protein [Solirubrobacteraceae bacterium]